MNSNFLTFLIIVVFYFIGSIIYCFLNKHRVGEKHLDYYGLEITEPQDIAFEASLWPMYLFMFIILFPPIFLTKLVEKLCGQKKK
jgi:hypothetical protein